MGYKKRILRLCLNLIIIILISMAASSCTKEKTDSAILIFFMGDVKIIDHNNNTKKAVIKEILGEGYAVKTGKDSFATLQIGDAIIVKIQRESSLKIDSILSTGQDKLFLNNGQVLSKIDKLKKNSTFSIKTPTSIAAVRGTEFSVSYSKGKSVIVVKNGTVNVKKHEGKEEKTINDGKAAVVTNNIKVRTAAKPELLEIQKVSIVPFIKNAENISPGELKKVQEDIKIKEKDIDEELKKIRRTAKPATLSDIKEKYGRVDEITLYTGKVYQGVILSRGSVYKILTTYGSISVPAKKVKRTRVIK